MKSKTPRISDFVIAWIVILCMVVVLTGGEKWISATFTGPWGQRSTAAANEDPTAEPGGDVALVVASIAKEDTSWATDHFPDWDVVVYVVDNATAEYTVPFNKAHEVSVYLTYIIDTYHRLPETVIFSHAGQYQWHNDDPLYDGQRVLKHLQLPYVQEEGYVNLRCDWFVGCPVELHPIEDATDPDHELLDIWDTTASLYMKEALEEMFPGVPVPQKIGVGCCAQFAVSRDQILARPLEEYERLRNWVRDTKFKDGFSGRFFEYSWHIIFGREPVHCPNVQECYCRTFGLCDLECNIEEGTCGWFDTSRPYPDFYAIPEGWPDVDLEGNPVNSTEIRIEQEKAYRHGDEDLNERHE